jgi:hypothetical protein
MIEFRCWWCRRRYNVKANHVGERITCSSCKNLLRVPKRSGGNCRVKSVVDWIVETLVCGGGGALLGFCISLLTLTGLFGMVWVEVAWFLIVGFTCVGLVAGLLFGERGIDWLGNIIRNLENR